MTEELRPKKSPATWGHCQRVYKAMEKESEKKVIFEEERVVYEGFLTKLFKQLGLSVPLYTEVRNELIRMGCITQLRRGGGPTPSVWVLFAAPTLEKYNEDVEERLDTPKGVGKRSAMEVLQAQINELRARVEVLENVLVKEEDVA